MDAIYAWEVTLLEPKNFWKEVPPMINDLYHFYNIPISSDKSHKDSPLRIIKVTLTLIISLTLTLTLTLVAHD
jgi:hypothetical protein